MLCFIKGSPVSCFCIFLLCVISKTSHCLSCHRKYLIILLHCLKGSSLMIVQNVFICYLKPISTCNYV